MILTTEKSAKAVKDFEENIGPMLTDIMKKSEPITETEKLTFWSIGRVYESYDVFRFFLSGVYVLFVKAQIQNKVDKLIHILSVLEEVIDQDEMS